MWWSKLSAALQCDPIFQLTLVGYVPLVGLGLLLGRLSLLLGALLWVWAVRGISWAASLGNIPRYSRVLTPLFYQVRLPFGPWCIVQRKPKDMDCEALRSALLEEARLLPQALAPGRYCAITHHTVLRRLQRMEGVTISVQRPVYRASLAHLRHKLTGGRCHRCHRTCPFRWASRQARTFFLVRFTIQTI